LEATKHREEGVARRAMIAFDRALSHVETHPDQTLLVRSLADLAEAKRSGRAAVILAQKAAASSKAAWNCCAAIYEWAAPDPVKLGFSPNGSQPARTTSPMLTRG